MLDQALNHQITHLTTAKDFMRWGASRFMEAKLTYGHGMLTALDESVYLVLRALYLPIDTPETYWDGKVEKLEIERILDFLTQRIETRKPAAYITREGWFAGLCFYVDERVLIPRSPIAEMVEDQFEPWIDANRVTDVLDMCTGSGCIGISCAYAFPDAQIDLSDISLDAVEVSKINIQNHDVSLRVSSIQSDVFDSLKNKRYDIIVSNPPYVDKEDMHALSDEFKHEPELGLASGTDGLNVTQKILAEAGKHLYPDGILVVEVGNSQYALSEKYPSVPFQWIDFDRGGDGVFILTAEQLEQHKFLFS
jgi:ribosomal protein L3 glutamine methyltransferase